MTREPDRFEEKTAEERVEELYQDTLRRLGERRWPGTVPLVAMVKAAEADALERAARTCVNEKDARAIRALVPPAVAPAAEWKCDACGDELASESAQRRHEATWHAAAPAADQDEVATFGAFGHGEPSEPVAPSPACNRCYRQAAMPGDHLCAGCRAKLDAEVATHNAKVTEPVAPSLLPRVLAVLDAEYRRRGGDDGGGYVGALAAELRRYIAELEGLLRDIEKTLAGRREREGASPATVSEIVLKIVRKLPASTAARTRGE